MEKVTSLYRVVVRSNKYIKNSFHRSRHSISAQNKMATENVFCHCYSN